MENKKIVMLAGESVLTDAIYNSINASYGIHTVIIEKGESKKVFLKRRIKRLGLWTVMGQIAFQLFIVKPLNLLSKKRRAEIIKQNNINIDPVPESKIIRVSSANSASAIQHLKDLNPDLVIVNATRILSKKVLRAIPAPFINTHFGITPMYRGVHGTYWALVNKDVANSGVTVHFVDEGIDTGNIINSIQVIPTTKDNFTTYPFLQLAAGIKILCGAVKDIFENNTRIKVSAGESGLWYHPTIWKYVYQRIVNKVK